jgi:hypothetical protein
MPHRSLIDPAFDGHLERPILELTVEERLDWLWEGMQLLHLGRMERERRAAEGENTGPW